MRTARTRATAEGSVKRDSEDESYKADDQFIERWLDHFAFPKKKEETLLMGYEERCGSG
jgi:hypothetical protein